MTGALRTWARRYFWLLLGLVGAQTLLGYGLYRVGTQSGERAAAQAQAAAVSAQDRADHCEAVLADCSASFQDLTGTLAKATEGLAQCAAAKPCCTVRVEQER